MVAKVNRLDARPDAHHKAQEPGGAMTVLPQRALAPVSPGRDFTMFHQSGCY